MNRILLGIFPLFLVSCLGGGSGKVSLKMQADNISDLNAVVQPAKELPPGAIPFYYSSIYKNISSLEGFIHTKEGALVADTFTFDTGTYGLILSDKNITKEGFKLTDSWDMSIHENKAIYKVTIGPWTVMIPTRPMSHKSLIGWDFFRGKIVKVSYRDSYLLTMDGTEEELKKYDRIKISRDRSGGRLLIPVEIQVQGKTIKGFILVDTGCNRSVILDNTVAGKHGINIEEGEEISYTHVKGKDTSYVLIANSIKTDHSAVENMEVDFSVNRNSWDRPDEFIGILGAGYLENFDVVFDFKNFYLYLRSLK